MQRTRIVILGGGFGGLATAMELERALAHRDDLEVLLVNEENYFLFTPMLHEVAASDLDLTTIVNPLRKLLRRVGFFCGACEGVDLERKVVALRHGEDDHGHEVPFDHLVVALGSVTNFFGVPGVAEQAITMRTLGDAASLRNRMIAALEEADFECCASQRTRLLTFVVAGGGFAGIETAAAMHDFLEEARPHYRNLADAPIRVVVAHSGEVILPELSPTLGRYAERKLRARGVEVRTGTRVERADGREVRLSDGTRLEAGTLVWTAGSAVNPLVASLDCEKERGRIRVDPTLRVAGRGDLWSLGDCASIPDVDSGGTHPPTAQHALREGRRLARNVLAAIDGRAPRPFRFRTLGQLASLGRRTGVARVFGVNFSGFVAWWLWRTIYLSKLPRIEKKVRVALDWTLDLVFSKDLVQFRTEPGRVARAQRLAPNPLAAAAPRRPSTPAARPRTLAPEAPLDPSSMEHAA